MARPRTIPRRNTVMASDETHQFLTALSKEYGITADEVILGLYKAADMKKVKEVLGEYREQMLATREQDKLKRRELNKLVENMSPEELAAVLKKAGKLPG